MIRAFVDGARDGPGENLHVEGEALLLAGWWPAGFRLAPDAFLVRDESPPVASTVFRDLTGELRERGLGEIPGDHPLVHVIALTDLSLTGVDWQVWTTDADRAAAVLTERASAESVPHQQTPDEMALFQPGDFTTQFEGARRIAGVPESLVVAVGLPDDTALGLEGAMRECRVEARSLAQLSPEACGELRPHLVVVDATDSAGQQYVAALRAAAGGRSLPVAAVTADTPPRGADVALDPSQPPSAWREQLLALL